MIAAGLGFLFDREKKNVKSFTYVTIVVVNNQYSVVLGIADLSLGNCNLPRVAAKMHSLAKLWISIGSKVLDLLDSMAVVLVAQIFRLLEDRNWHLVHQRMHPDRLNSNNSCYFEVAVAGVEHTFPCIVDRMVFELWNRIINQITNPFCGQKWTLVHTCIDFSTNSANLLWRWLHWCRHQWIWRRWNQNRALIIDLLLLIVWCSAHAILWCHILIHIGCWSCL